MNNKYQAQFDTFLNNHSIRTVTTQKALWEYYSGGSGSDAILMLHGGGSIAEATYRYFLEFEKEYKVIAPTMPASLSTVRDAIDGINAILDNEGIRKVHILGFSMGGMIAQAYLREYPEKVESLVLFVSMLPSVRYIKKFSKARNTIARFPAFLVNWISKFSLRRQILAENVEIDNEEREFWVNVFQWTFDSGKMNKDTLVSTATVLLDYYKNYNFEINDLDNWNRKILIYEAEKDRIVDEVERERLKQAYKNAEIITLKNSGHFGLGLIKPEEIIKKMLTFFKTS